MAKKSRSETLFSIAEQIRKCTACPLWKSRTLAVPGEGPEKARIMLVGEAPGAEEDRQGLPFIGRSGKFMNEMLAVAGLERKDVFITGAVKCHPPKNRTPAMEEIKACKSLWLGKQVEAIKPEIIILMGNVALSSLLGKTGVNELHGKMVEKEENKYFITFHPSGGMRFPEIKQKITADFKKLRGIKETKLFEVDVKRMLIAQKNLK